MSPEPSVVFLESRMTDRERALRNAAAEAMDGFAEFNPTFGNAKDAR